MQIAIQAVLLSDGVTSFASFTYADPEAVATASARVVGFDAGDRSNSAEVFAVAEQNVFRIDGMIG